MTASRNTWDNSCYAGHFVDDARPHSLDRLVAGIPATLGVPLVLGSGEG
jgi:hypothetical protein